MVKRRKEKQQTLEATLGRPRVRATIKSPKVKNKSKGPSGSLASSSPARDSKSSPMAPPSSFMHSSQVFGSARKKRVVLDDSSSEEASEDDDVVEVPVREANCGKKRGVSDSESNGGSPAEDSNSNSDEGNDDDEPLVIPKPRHKRRIVTNDSDDEPLVSSPVKRRRLVRGNAALSPAKGRSDEDEDGDEGPASSSARPSQKKRKRLTQKEKARELLRRKRAGEVINEEEESSSSGDEEPAKAMYDTDSDHPALEEFEDDEEDNLDLKNDGKNGRKKKKDKKKKQKATEDAGSDASINDFVVDDSDTPLGAPDEHMDMPLEFTAQAHKPLKQHFRDAIEWLVQFKINPGFEREHMLYRLAWKKLDDEVRGLATSKFASSAWRIDFYKALRARPYLDNQELSKGGRDETENCGACGRAGHPAKHVITFTGTPYYKDTTQLARFLEPVELSSDSDSDSEDKKDDEDEDEDEDEDGNSIPKETKTWSVGVVCNSNAEMAHSLMHWKHELLDWVDSRLHQEGYMLQESLAKREKMGPKKKHKLVDNILSSWVRDGVVRDLYQAFKGTMEAARNKPTTGRYGRG